MKKVLVAVMILLILSTCSSAMAKTLSRSSEFREQLGIAFDADSLGWDQVKMEIEGGKIGIVRAELADESGKKSEWILRFISENDFSTLQELSGPAGNSSPSLDLGKRNGIRLSLTQAGEADIYFWSAAGARYCLILKGNYGNQLFSEQIDGILSACGR